MYLFALLFFGVHTCLDSLSYFWSCISFVLLYRLICFLRLKVVKKRRHYVGAINLLSIAWAAHLAKKRAWCNDATTSNNPVIALIQSKHNEKIVK